MVILGSACGMEDRQCLVEEVEARGAAFNLFYQLPRAALTKDQKLGDLKQSNFIVSQFWRVEVQNQSVGMAMFFLTAPGRESPALLFVGSGVCQQSLAYGCITLVTWPSSSHVCSHPLPLGCQHIFLAAHNSTSSTC